MSVGNAFTKPCTVPGVKSVQGVWTGGGAAANCTRSTDDQSSGIVSVNYNAATGKYLITFSGVGQQIVFPDVVISRAAGSAPLIANVVRGSLSQSAKTVAFEVWGITAGAYALADLAATDKVMIKVEFASSKKG